MEVEVTHVPKCLQDWVLRELNAAFPGSWQYRSACQPEGISQTDTGAAPLGPSKQAAASAVHLTYASPGSVVLELSFVCG